MRRLARWRAVVRVVFSRRSSRRWERRVSRWRVRLLDFRAEVVRGGSESRRRVSWDMRASRWEEENVLAMSRAVLGGSCLFWLNEMERARLGGGTFSSRSWIAASVCCSSSVGFGGMLVACENWEYL